MGSVFIQAAVGGATRPTLRVLGQCPKVLVATRWKSTGQFLKNVNVSQLGVERDETEAWAQVRSVPRSQRDRGYHEHAVGWDCGLLTI